MRSKWHLHLTVLAVLAAIVVCLAAVLFSSADGRGLDGLGSALAGGVLLIALAAHALVSTLVVACTRDRRGVVIAHVAAPLVFIAVGSAFFAVG